MAKNSSAKFVRPDADARQAQAAKTMRLRSLRLAKEAEDAEKAAPLHPEMKVIFMSGHADEGLIGEGIKGKQGTAFLQKPFTSTQLANKMRDVLDVHGKNRHGG